MRKILLFIAIALLTACSSKELIPNEIDNDEKNNTESETTEIALVFDDVIDASENKEEYRYILSEIRIRSEATKNGEIVGHVYEGEHYKVLDTKTNEGLTWYCIDDDKWIADDGTWTSKFYNIHFKSNNGSKEENVQGYGFGMDDMMMDWLLLDYNRFSTDNYVFVGWNTLPDGSGTYYHETEAVRNVCNDNSDVYLYAQWVPVKEKNIKIRATSDLNVMDGPSYKYSKAYGAIRENDYFTILESIEFDGKIWDRIATDSWIIDQRDKMETIEEYPYDFKNINKADYHLPRSIEQISYHKDGLQPYENDSIITFTFNYNSDGSLSYVSNDYEFKGNGAYEDDYSYRPFGLNSVYYYGDNVENELDNAGNIVRQTITNKWIWNGAVNTSTTINEYTYNEKGVASKLLIQDVNDRTADIIYKYEYNNDGQLVKQSWGMANSAILNTEDVFEYNGNLVFEFERWYSADNQTNKQEWSQLRKWGFYRYDTDGRIVEARDDYGIGAPDYAYYYSY